MDSETSFMVAWLCACSLDRHIGAPSLHMCTFPAAIRPLFLCSSHSPPQVGSNLFAHGGVLPAHVEYGLARINK